MLDYRSWNFECACGGKHLTKRRDEPKRPHDKAFCAFYGSELPTRQMGFNLYYTPVEAPPKGEF